MADVKEILVQWDAGQGISAIARSLGYTRRANGETRALAKAALRLAVALQHRRTADYRTAALCVEATLSVVNILAIVTGRRDRRPAP